MTAPLPPGVPPRPQGPMPGPCVNGDLSTQPSGPDTPGNPRPGPWVDEPDR